MKKSRIIKENFRKLKTLSTLLLAILSFSSLEAQNYLGRWTSYLPYNKAFDLAVTPGKVYCTTRGGLFYFNLNDNSIEKLSRENGLSDIEITSLNYSPEADVLLISYSNANIDLIEGNTIINIPDIKRSQIIGDKTIYDCHFIDDRAYLSLGFGIVVLDLTRKEIKETYYIGEGGSQVRVNDITHLNNFIYAATEEGLYSADLNNSNLIDFNNWTRDLTLPDPNREIHTITSAGNYVYLSHKDPENKVENILYLNGEAWVNYPYFTKERIIRDLDNEEDDLIIVSNWEVDIFDPQGNSSYFISTGRPFGARVAGDGTLWIADEERGLVRYLPPGEPVDILPEGPSGINVTSLEFHEGKLIGVAGGTNGSWNNLYRNGEFYMLDDKQWTNYFNTSVKDFLDIEFDPDDPGHFYIASWGFGLLEFRGDELVENYREENSTLQSVIPGDFVRIGGIAYDQDKNLWVCNGGTPSPLSVLTPQGDWISFDIASAVNAPNMAEIIVTRDNRKWIMLQGGNGLFVFDDNRTPANKDDDEFKKISVRNRDNQIISNDIYTLEEDLNGNIWLGTNKGIVVYYSPSRVFEDDNFYAQQIIVPRKDDSGLGDPLLGSETVTAIEVDGANRKWIGTQNGGVFLVSEDGFEEIHAFNTDNSPLLSNTITDIAINDETGEVYIGTAAGIISFFSDAIAPAGTFDDVYVFPNPVREDYEGEIIVKGLVENTNVKITDLNGNLVFETESLGGQAIWDGRNLNGNRVATGVYLVFCTNEDGSATHVTKLLFIH